MEYISTYMSDIALGFYNTAMRNTKICGTYILDSSSSCVAFLVSRLCVCVCDVLGACSVTLLVVLTWLPWVSPNREGIGSTLQFGELNMWCIYCFMVPVIGCSHQFMETGKTTWNPVLPCYIQGYGSSENKYVPGSSEIRPPPTPTNSLLRTEVACTR